MTFELHCFYVVGDAMTKKKIDSHVKDGDLINFMIKKIQNNT